VIVSETLLIVTRTAVVLITSMNVVDVMVQVSLNHTVIVKVTSEIVKEPVTVELIEMNAVYVMVTESQKDGVLVKITKEIVKEPVVVQLVLMFVVNVVILLMNHVVSEHGWMNVIVMETLKIVKVSAVVQLK